MENNKHLSICTFNCRSFKNSLPVIHDLCEHHDIVMLQEHWLLPNELGLLNNVHDKFQSYGLSAVDVSIDILVGRPFGGTAILYRKSLAEQVTVVASDESRITSIQLDTNFGPLLLLNVYMPTNYGDESSLELYRDCLAKLHAVITDTDSLHTIIAGDFNCCPGSRFFVEFNSFATENNLVLSDLNRLNNVITYVSDDATKTSWIDHILCSWSADTLIDNINVINDVVISDHKPVSFNVICTPSAVHSHTQTTSYSSNYRVPLWSTCDYSTLDHYADYLDNLLQQVSVPSMVIKSDNSSSEIEQFYRDVFACISKATAYCIPSRQQSSSDFNVPGWNTYVSEKHDAARKAYTNWLDVGKPKFGYYFDCMKRTRAVFKLALRYCRNHVEQLKADACAESLFDKDPRKFWNSVYKLSNSKASCHITSIGGACGAENVANMWKTHFQELYRDTDHNKYQNIFQEKVSANNMAVVDTPLLNVQDIVNAISSQKRGKAAGPDGIHTDAFVYGCHRLKVYLCIMFNLFLMSGYIPDAFCQSTIIPLVKCKSGDLSDVNNYRAIALSNSASKILETLLFDFIETSNATDIYQFGFRKNHSTSICTHVFKKTVDYYRQNGSHVFTCFIDFNKAFDNVDYWLLFCKLIDSNDSITCFCSTRLLASWYSRQSMCVRWQNVCSDYFNVNKGVRQGGILSPFLFRFYIRDLIFSITSLNIGCNFAGTNVSLLAYADDIVLLAPSWRALQYLLGAVEVAGININMTFNTRKTVCMVFNPSDRGKIVAKTFPAFSLSNCSLVTVNQFKYLGHIIDNSFSDDSDINREIKTLFTRTNILSRRFKRCSLAVKLRLFRTFCMCFFDIALWTDFTVGAINRFASCYYKCIKCFFGYPKYSSVTNMLFELGLPSFNTLIHNSKLSFANRASACDNAIVRCVLLFNSL